VKTTVQQKNLHLTNTMKRTKVEFVPRNPPRVMMFTCGPSVYRTQHIGNYRTFFYEDILQRYLEYLDYSVDRLINYTDIEDKSIDEAGQKGISLQALTRPIEERFVRDCRFLGIRLPQCIARSSASVDTAVEIIQYLVDKGHVYAYGPDFYFDPLTVDDFGRLYGLDMSRWPKKKIRFSKDTYPGQRWNLGDFIVWHGYRQEDPVYWDTPIGRGLPAWNIQDPAMIVKHLAPSLDISCGGIDNLYRHHDYTIAVIEAYSGQELAPYWLHGEHLLVDGRKMSKQRNNMLLPSTLRDKGYTGHVIRFLFAQRHYRRRLNFTYEVLDRAARRHAALTQVSRVFTHGVAPDRHAARTSTAALDIMNGFAAALSDDLHTERALDNLEAVLVPLAETRREGMLAQKDTAGICHALKQIDSVLDIGL